MRPILSQNGLSCVLCKSNQMLKPDIQSLSRINISCKNNNSFPFVSCRSLMLSLILWKGTVFSILNFTLRRFEECIFVFTTTIDNNREQLNNNKTTMVKKRMYIIIYLYYDCYQDGLYWCWNKLIWEPWNYQLKTLS